MRNVGRSVEVDDGAGLLELREPGDEVALVVDDERTAVEDELVLAADLVHVDDGGVGVLGAGGDHALALDPARPEVRRRVED